MSNRHKQQFFHQIPNKTQVVQIHVPNYKSKCPEQYKTAMLKNLIYFAKLITSTKTIFNSELKNIKQTLIKNDFPNHIVY